jgi:predicted porin
MEDDVYNGDFNEVRVAATYQFTDAVNVFSNVGYSLGNSRDNQTYLDAGVSFDVFDRYSVSALASGVHYDSTSETRFNNAQVRLNYSFTDNVNIYSGYSLGGSDEFDFDLPNETVFGVSYNF